MISVTTDSRYNTCQKYKEYLYLIYYLGGKILTAVQLYNFILKTEPKLSKSKFERDLKALEDSGIIRKELICLNNNPNRMRVLYLRKYAVAFVEGAETTKGVNNINFSRVTPEIILQHVVRADVIFSHMQHIDYRTILESIKIFKSNLSTYFIKKNQSHAYMTDLFDYFSKLDVASDVDKEHLKWEFEKSKELFFALEKGRLDGGRHSRINNTKKGIEEGLQELAVSDEVYIEESPKTSKTIMQERIDNYGLTTMLYNYDVYFLRTKEEQIILNLDMIVTKKIVFWRIMSDIIGVYRYFSYFFNETSNVIVRYRIYFADKLAAERFNIRYAKKSSDYFIGANISRPKNLDLRTYCADSQGGFILINL